MRSFGAWFGWRQSAASIESHPPTRTGGASGIKSPRSRGVHEDGGSGDLGIGRGRNGAIQTSVTHLEKVSAHLGAHPAFAAAVIIPSHLQAGFLAAAQGKSKNELRALFEPEVEFSTSSRRKACFPALCEDYPRCG